MQVLVRLRYALFLSIAITMVVMLALSIGEGIGFIRGIEMRRWMLHPLYVVPMLLIAFALAPWLSARMLISGDRSEPQPREKAPFGFAVRSLALVGFGLALALLANLLVFLLGELT